jgi:hypothetical protein
MLVVLPLLCFGLLLRAFWRRHPCADPREWFVWSALCWGVLSTLLVEVLSLFSALSATTVALGWAGAAAGAALLGGRPVGLERPKLAWPARLPRPESLVLGAPIVVVVLLTGLLAVVGWPNEGDSLRYHLIRAVHWIQNQSVAFYPTHFARQNYFPPWSEQAMLHLMLLGWDDRAANLVQWFSMLGSLVGVSLIAQYLGAGARGQLFSALFCATLPMGILQASTNQNDYVTAFWLVCLVSALLAWRDRPASTVRALGVGAALGLAVYTKGTAYLYVLPLLLGLAPYRAPLWSAGWLRSVPLIGLLALALNAPHFARNYESYRLFLGPREMVDTQGNGPGLTNQLYSLPVFTSNIVRNASLHLATPLPAVNAALANLIVDGHRWLGIEADDPRTTWDVRGFSVRTLIPDSSFAGNLVHLLLIVAVLPWLASPAGWRKAGDARWYAVVLLAAFALFCLLFKWQPFHSRLHLPLFVLWSPVVGVAFQPHARFTAIAAVLMAVWAWPFLVGSTLHPLAGERSVFKASRADQQFRYQSALRRDYVGVAELLASIGCSQIGFLPEQPEFLAAGAYNFEYPFRSLLAERLPGPVRIQHVAVRNYSSVRREMDLFASRLPPFNPCALIVGAAESAESFELEGRVYRLAWTSDRVHVLLPNYQGRPQTRRS